MIKNLTWCCILLCASFAHSQVDHWETIINNSDDRDYTLPSSEPSASWAQTGFNTGSWSTGPGGIGYDDGDDNTIIAVTTSVYQRIEFNVVDASVIQEMIFNVDYDDGFVAYLNGTEIARGNMSGNPPAFDDFADGNHEAEMYNGGSPDQYFIDAATTASLITTGNNVLAVQVHNVNATSSDMSSLLWLHVGITDASSNYSATPPWFVSPVVFESSDIPIMVVDANGQAIPDDPKIDAYLGIINNGTGIRNYITDPHNDYAGDMGIEKRGSTSQTLFPKKGYGFETRDALGANNNVMLLGMPAENDWVLHNPYSDKTLMRNALTYQLGNLMGHWTPRVRHVELQVNNEYLGVYVLMEKIKRDSMRVDIADLDTLDVTGDQLTGGYIIKVDKTTGNGNDGWYSNYAPWPGSSHQVYYQFHYPPADDLKPSQKNYIEFYMHSFEDMMNSTYYTDSTIGYLQWIDTESFVDFLIINELSRNVDGYRLSSFFHKDKDSKGGLLHAGPYWDFNIAWGNANYCDGDLTTGWAYNFGNVCDNDGYQIPFYWERLISDPSFMNHVRCRWEQLRQPGQPLHIDAINSRIDSMATYLNEAQGRNFIKWPILGTWVWPNPQTPATYADEILNLKSWIAQRASWIDINLPSQTGNCSYILAVEETVAEQVTLQAYPSPFQRQTMIELPSAFDPSTSTIQIIDMQGRIQQSKHHIEADILVIDGTNMRAGMYMVIIQDRNKRYVCKLSKL